MNYYNEIKNELINNEVYKKVKNYSKNRIDLTTYYNVRKLLVEAQGGESRTKYGNQLIKEYSNKLINEVGKKYNERTLRRIRQFYITFKDINWSPLATTLSWSTLCELLPIKEVNCINYYITLMTEYNLSKREIRIRVKSKEYERLDEETKEKLIKNEDNIVTDYERRVLLSLVDSINNSKIYINTIHYNIYSTR